MDVLAVTVSDLTLTSQYATTVNAITQGIDRANAPDGPIGTHFSHKGDTIAKATSIKAADAHHAQLPKPSKHVFRFAVVDLNSDNSRLALLHSAGCFQSMSPNCVGALTALSQLRAGHASAVTDPATQLTVVSADRAQETVEDSQVEGLRTGDTAQSAKKISEFFTYGTGAHEEGHDLQLWHASDNDENHEERAGDGGDLQRPTWDIMRTPWSGGTVFEPPDVQIINDSIDRIDG